MTNINPAAKAAQDQARRANGEFGNQQHTQPEPFAPTQSPHPERMVIGGQLVYLPDAAPDYQEEIPEWPQSLGKSEATWEYDDDGVPMVMIEWNEGKNSAWFVRGPFGDTYSSFDTGDDEDAGDLTPKEKDAVKARGEWAVSRAADVVSNVEYVAMNDPHKRAQVTRLLDPTPFTPEEIERNEADLNVQKACDDAGLSVMAGIIDALRDREALSDAKAKELTADDIERMYYQRVAKAIDELEDEL